MPLVTRLAAQTTTYAQASAPTATIDGEIWIDTDTGAAYVSEGGSWIPQTVGAIGTARQQLAVNSNADGLEYVASLQSLMTAQADMIYASAANTPVRLAKGTGGHFLRVNAGATALEWAAAGATVSTQESIVATDQTITTATPTDVTNATLTMPTRTGGKALITINIGWANTVIAKDTFFRILDNAVTQEIYLFRPELTGPTITTLTYVTTLAGQVVKLQANSDQVSTVTIYGSGSGNSNTVMSSLEIS